MKRIVSLVMIGLMLNSSLTTSCGSKRLNTAHFFDDSGNDADTEGGSEQDGSVDPFDANNMVEQPGHGIRGKGEKVETHDFGAEPRVSEVDKDNNERGDAGRLTSDGKVTIKSSGISSVTENQTADNVAEEKKNGQPSGGQGQDTRAEQDSVPFGPADPSNGNLTNRRSDGCINCGGSEFSGISGSGMVKTNTYSSIEDLNTSNTKQLERLKEHIRPASEGGAEKRQRLSDRSENLRNQHNETVARLKAKFAAENAKLGSKIRFKTSEKSAIGRDIRDVAARFENTNNQILNRTGDGLLNAADRAAYLGKLTSASAFTAEAKRLSQAAENGSLPSEVFDANHNPDYSSGNFNEANEKIKAGRAAIDLYNAASDLAAEKSPAATAALGVASLLLDVALGAARFSTIVDVPFSAMEAITGKTVEFDANGNPMIVEASTVTRAAAALTLGLTAAAFVTTGGLAAVGVAAAMGFIPGIVRAAKKALSGIGKTEKAAETVADIERTAEKIVSKAENLGINLAATNARLGEKALEALNDSRVVEAAKDWGTSKDGVNQLLEHSIGKTSGTEINRLPGLEKHAGLVAGSLSNAGSNDAQKVADAVTNIDKLAKDILNKGTTKNTGAGKTETWIGSVVDPSKGISVIKFEEKIQSVLPRAKAKFDSIGVE